MFPVCWTAVARCTYAVVMTTKAEAEVAARVEAARFSTDGRHPAVDRYYQAAKAAVDNKESGSPGSTFADQLEPLGT